MGTFLIELKPCPCRFNLVNLSTEASNLLIVFVPSGHQDLNLGLCLLHPLPELFSLHLVPVHIIGQPLLVVLILAHSEFKQIKNYERVTYDDKLMYNGYSKRQITLSKPYFRRIGSLLKLLGNIITMYGLSRNSF